MRGKSTIARVKVYDKQFAITDVRINQRISRPIENNLRSIVPFHIARNLIKVCLHEAGLNAITRARAPEPEENSSKGIVSSTRPVTLLQLTAR